MEQEWFSGKWKKPSKLRFELSEKDGKTKVSLAHANVPSEELDDIDKGWDDYYLGPIKNLLES